MEDTSKKLANAHKADNIMMVLPVWELGCLLLWFQRAKILMLRSVYGGHVCYVDWPWSYVELYWSISRSPFVSGTVISAKKYCYCDVFCGLKKKQPILINNFIYSDSVTFYCLMIPDHTRELPDHTDTFIRVSSPCILNKWSVDSLFLLDKPTILNRHRKKSKI